MRLMHFVKTTIAYANVIQQPLQQAAEFVHTISQHTTWTQASTARL